MANSTDNIDIVSKEDLDRLKELDTSLKAVNKTFGELLKTVSGVASELSKPINNAKALADVIGKVEEAEKSRNSTYDEEKRLISELERLRERLSKVDSEQAKAVAQVRVELQAKNKANREEAQATSSAIGSIDKMKASLKQLRSEYRALSEAKRADINVGGAMLKQIEELASKTKQLETEIANPKKKWWLQSRVLIANLATQAVNGIGKVLSKGKEWVKQGIIIAGKAEGVRKAFAKLNDPNLLKNLQQATKGTVNDLMLMQSAVKAETLGIPLDKLGKMFKFAQQRAQETKESVDYLTTSIVNGIGRKSTLILDNLGISAARLSQEIKKTGDFTSAAVKIIEEELTKQGDLALTSADKAEQASVKWQNAQLRIGGGLKWLGDVWSSVSGGIADTIASIAGDWRTATQVYDDQITKVVDLERNIVPLLKRYDELKSKAELSKDEHIELNKVMNSISNTIPGIITEFDKYGNLLSLNTAKAYEYIKAEKAKLAQMYKGSIREQERIIADANEKLDKYNREHEMLLGAREGARMRYSKRNLLDTEKGIEKQNRVLVEANAELGRLNGTTMEEQYNARAKLEEQRTEFNKMTKKQLDAWIDDEKNAASEYIVIAKQIRSQRFALSTDEPKPKDKKEDKEEDKNAKAELKATQELAALILKTDIDSRKAVATNDEESYVLRTMALKEFVAKQKELLAQSTENQIEGLVDGLMSEKDSPYKTREDAEKALAAQIKLIRAKEAAELIKIDNDGYEISLDLAQDYAERNIGIMARSIEREVEALEQGEQDKLVALAQMYGAGEISAEEYESRKVEIARNSALERFEIEISALENLLDTVELTSDQREEIEKQLGKARIDYAKYVGNTIVADEDSTAKKREEIERKLADVRKQLIGDVMNFASALADRMFKKDLKRLDKEAKAYNESADEEVERIDRLEESGAISKEQADARKALVDQQAEERQEEIEKKKIEIMRKQAIFEKAMSASQVIINTAVAVAAAWAAGPATGVALTPFIIASGALQLATIMATPLPEYALGTQDHKGGLAVVGDGGRHEMVVTPGGSIYKTPNVDTVMNLPKHSIVYPDFAKAYESMAFTKIEGVADKTPEVVLKVDNLERLQGESVKSINKFMASYNRGKLTNRYQAMLGRRSRNGIYN